MTVSATATATPAAAAQARGTCGQRWNAEKSETTVHVMRPSEIASRSLSCMTESDRRCLSIQEWSVATKTPTAMRMGAIAVRRIASIENAIAILTAYKGTPGLGTETSINGVFFWVNAGKLVSSNFRQQRTVTYCTSGFPSANQGSDHKIRNH